MQKLKGDFLKTLEDFRKKENENFEQSHSLEKVKKCQIEPLGLFQHPICCKISKTLKGEPFGDFRKFSKKMSHKAEKSGKGRFSIVRFCKCTEKFLAEAGIPPLLGSP